MKKSEILIGLGLALFVAVVLSPFASPSPDGLERVAEDHGFLSKAAEGPMTPPMIPDYAMPGISSEKLATSAAGFVGTLILYFGGYGMARLLKSRKNAASDGSPHEA
ncbi:MAG: PDGLE domain-containing protein [Candidatus Omnitrophota bacterium]